MKKVLLVAVIAMAAVACKKSYTCTIAGQVVEYPDLTKDQAKTAQSTCEMAPGAKWSAK